MLDVHLAVVLRTNEAKNKKDPRLKSVFTNEDDLSIKINVCIIAST